MVHDGDTHRGYQDGFSDLVPGVLNTESRDRKAETMLRVLRDHLGSQLAGAVVLDVGASGGIIDAYLAGHVRCVVGIDIDTKAIRAAHAAYTKDDLHFAQADAMSLPLADNSVDVVICAHVYEHVPDATRLMAEIHRVLRAGGVCYFAAGNRFQWKEPHYNIRLLSAIPRPLAHWVIRRKGVADHYYELHFSLLGLRRLTSRFERRDYTLRLIREPDRYATTYMVPVRGLRARLMRALAGMLYPLIPTYVWLLVKRG